MQKIIEPQARLLKNLPWYNIICLVQNRVHAEHQLRYVYFAQLV